MTQSHTTSRPVHHSHSHQAKTEGGGSGGVEIATFPQALHTRSFGDPDVLFVPLLDATRDAYQMMSRLNNHGEGNAATLSGMQLASALLRDPHFTLAAKGISHEHTYTIDFAADSLRVSTRLYAAVSRRTSLFRVQMVGKISGGPFVIVNTLNGAVMMQVEEENLRQSNFFSTILAQECLRIQIDQERLSRFEETVGSPSRDDVRLRVGKVTKIPVVLRNKEDGKGWDIIDGRVQEWVGTLPPEMEEHLRDLNDYLQELFSQK